MPLIERRRPRRFRILYIPLGQAWRRFVLRQDSPAAPPLPGPAADPTLPPMSQVLFQGPETLRRQGSRRS